MREVKNISQGKKYIVISSILGGGSVQKKLYSRKVCSFIANQLHVTNAMYSFGHALKYNCPREWGWIQIRIWIWTRWIWICIQDKRGWIWIWIQDKGLEENVLPFFSTPVHMHDMSLDQNSLDPNSRLENNSYLATELTPRG